MARVYYTFYFALADGRDHAPRIHEVRDGAAFAELAPALCSRGALGWPLFNFFPRPERELTLDDFSQEDWIVVPTRLPLDDWRTRKTIPTSGGRLEVAIFEAVRPFFPVLAREFVALHPDLARELPDGYENRAKMWFHTYRGRGYNVGARYAGYRSPKGRRSAPDNPAATAAFVIVIRLRAGGPTLLAAFGMDGATTLAWCHLLAVRYPALLEGERFVMAELIADPMPERPADLSFVERWDVRILLDHRLGGGSQQAA